MAESVDEELEALKKRTEALERDIAEWKGREQIREEAVDEIAERIVGGGSWSSESRLRR
jgi:hypothetical protein